VKRTEEVWKSSIGRSGGQRRCLFKRSKELSTRNGQRIRQSGIWGNKKEEGGKKRKEKGGGKKREEKKGKKRENAGRKKGIPMERERLQARRNSSRVKELTKRGKKT